MKTGRKTIYTLHLSAKCRSEQISQNNNMNPKKNAVNRRVKENYPKDYTEEHRMKKKL